MLDEAHQNDITAPLAQTAEAEATAPEKPGLFSRIGSVVKGKAKVAVTAVRFIREFHSRQDEIMFRPHPPGIMPLKSPADYDELRPYNFETKTIVTDRDLRGRPAATIETWTHWGSKDQPHFIFFPGRAGHIADTGPGDIAGYDRHGGLKFIAEHARNEAGITVVTGRGFGNNKGKPSEKGCQKDIKIFQREFAKEWAEHNERSFSDFGVTSGYSLGASNAAYAGKIFSRRTLPPTGVDLGNGMLSATQRAKEMMDDHLRKSEDPYLRGKKVPLALVRFLLKHHFNTAADLSELPSTTYVSLCSSENDEITHPFHSERLRVRAELHHPVSHHCFENRGHFDVSPELYAQHMLKTFEAQRGPERRAEEKRDEMRFNRDGVYHMARTTVVNGSWEEQVARDRKAEKALAKPRTSVQEKATSERSR